MSDRWDDRRMVWSCSLLSLPEEDEAHRLEDRLRARERSFWDDAEDLREYLRLTGMSQAACARELGRSQASVANRLRLLKLPQGARARMRAAGLTERHARALLRLSAEDAIRSALDHVLAAELNVAETEAYVERCLIKKRGHCPSDAAYEPLLSALEQLRRTVPEISFVLEEDDAESRFCIRIPKKSRNLE